MTIATFGLAVVAAGLLAHALFSLWLMLYAWEHPEQLRSTAGPTDLEPPGLSFTVLLPAREEAGVIDATIRRVWAADYPADLLELVVICQFDDQETIDAVNGTIAALGAPQIRLAIYDEKPFNKPHGLTVGLSRASGDVVTVFDAEDDVHPDIFNIVNTTMLREEVGVVQGGVQLMNFRDHWFSVFNCLEYFFYFKSKLHFNARAGVILLGGNTVFFRRQLLEQVGGWDIGCLTEDADIGLRLSARGEQIRVIYDSRWVTREETPHTVGGLVRQRTRWHQGFLQVLWKRDWRRLAGRRRRLLAFVTLAQPVLDGALLATLPLIPLALIYLNLPITVALMTFAPLYAVGLQMLANIAGLIVFARDFDQRLPWRVLLRMPFTYLPYQWLIAVSALRASGRQIRGDRGWEKTQHLGAHRAPALRHADAEGIP
jgi:cellulose synthase/poly-beta-1,6-N-acetylglucosamine synthase-like glycosyltransferase